MAITGVLETSVYFSTGEREAVEGFYAEVLGLREVARWPDGIAYRAGAGVVLAFERESLDQRESPISRHGSVGPGHVCLLAADDDDYAAWRRRLDRAGVTVTHEESWGGGRRSLYFDDPAGNLIEIASTDIWPR